MAQSDASNQASNNSADEPHPLVVNAGRKVIEASGAREAGEPPTAEDAARSLLEHPERISTFAGYLGGFIDDTEGATKTKWQCLYFDAKLSTGLLVDEDDIVVRDRMDDEKAAFGKRDVIWVKADGAIRRVSGPTAIWLSGPFTRAGDFDASPTGGTFAGGEDWPPTPRCCGRATR